MKTKPTNIKKIICWFKGHKRGRTKYNGNKYWFIECKRCGYCIAYRSPCARLVSTETKFGFDGN